jgi:hypothetical protein
LPRGRILATVLEHRARSRTFGETCFIFYGSILSAVGASSEPGAIQPAYREARIANYRVGMASSFDYRNGIKNCFYIESAGRRKPG